MKIFRSKSKLAVMAAALLLLAFALAVGVFTQQATARPPSGGGSAGSSNNAFAVGGITTFDGPVAFAAHNLPNNKIVGHVVQDSFGTSRSGPVDCLTVAGNHATILWHVTSSDNSGEIGQYRLFEMCDYGE